MDTIKFKPNGKCVGCTHNREGFCDKVKKWAFMISKDDCLKNDTGRKMIKCKNTGALYKDIKSVVARYGCSIEAVRKHLNRDTKTLKGDVLEWTEV